MPWCKFRRLFCCPFLTAKKYIACIPNMFVYYLLEGFSYRPLWGFFCAGKILIYTNVLFIFLFKKKYNYEFSQTRAPWGIPVHTDLLALCALCSRHVTVVHGLGLSRVPPEPETLLVRLTEAPEIDQSSGRPHG